MLEQRDLLAGFTPGNLIVNTIGTGATLDGAATPVTLREYGLDNVNTPTAATLVNSITAPFSNPGNNSGNLTDSGSVSSHGALNLSTDGARISFVGYDAPAGLASIATSSSTTNSRVVGTVNADGQLILDTYTDAYSGGSIRAAISSSATTHWLAGTTGVRYASAGMSTSIVSNTARFVTIATDASGNQFLIGNTATTVIVWPAPISLPTLSTIPQPLSLPGLGTDLGEVVMLDRSPTRGATNLGGIDTIYVTNGQSSTTGSIAKFEWSGTAWVSRSSRTYANGLNGLAARVTASDVQLFATTRLNTGNNQLLTRTDTAGFGSDISTGNFTVLATSGSGYGFRGATFTPDEVTEAPLQLQSGTEVIADGSPATVLDQVTYANGSSFKGGALAISGGQPGDTVSISNIAGQITTNGNTVLYNGTQIGTFSGGDGSTALQIDFNARNSTDDISTAMVVQLLKQIQFATTSSDSNRPLTFNLSQAANHKSVAESVSQSVTVTIQPSATNQPPTAIQLSNVVANLAENSDTVGGRKLANITVMDDGRGTYSLSLNGTDASRFEIRGNELWLRDGVTLNFETQGAYHVTVAVDDTEVGTTPDATADYQLTITDVNEAPAVWFSGSVNQLPETTLSPSPRKLADVVILDDALGTETLSLNGADAGLFELIGQELYLKAGTTFDFETRSTYSVMVNIDDLDLPRNPDAAATFNLQILDIFEPPEIEVTVNGTDLVDGGTLNFGAVALNTPVTCTLTVKNIGSGVLTLQPINITGSDFMVTSGNFTVGQTLAVNASATVTLTMNTSTNGTKSGALSFVNSDANESPFNLNLSGAVVTAANGVTLIDDGDTGFQQTGVWNSVTGYGYGNDARAATGSDGSKRVNWVFGGLTPGQYRIEATWLPGSDRASAVPYTFHDGIGGTAVGNTIVNQRLAPVGATSANGRPFAVLSTVTITGTTLVVEMSNLAANGAVIADAVRIVSVTPPPNTPEIDVLDGTVALNANSQVDFGQLTQGTTFTKSFTVKNTGTADLVLQPVTVEGTAFSLASPNFTVGQLLAPNSTATITVAASTTFVGSFTGGLSFGNNDSDEGPFRLTFSAQVNPAGATSFIIDDGSAEFSLAGAWNNVVGYGYGSDAKAATGNNGANRATWTFSGLSPGDYRIDTTWLPGSDRASNAPYIIRDGSAGGVLSSVGVNQRSAPSGTTTAGGRPFTTLGTVTITGTTLVIELSNTGTNGAIIADAVRIERITPAPNMPRLEVKDGTTTLMNAGLLEFGSASQGGAALTKTITVTNTGTADLVLQPINVTGTAYSLVSPNFTAGQILAPNASVTLTIQLSTTTAATHTGSVSFGHSTNGPFTLQLSGTVSAPQPPGVYLMDDGDSGFSVSGSWNSVAGYGYGSDARAATGSDGSKVATWNFTGLEAGTYRVDATWLPGSDRTSQAPYVIRDAVGGNVLATINMDQRVTPTGAASAGGRPFAPLGTVSVVNGTLVIQLSNLGTNGAIIADAIRLTKIG